MWESREAIKLSVNYGDVGSKRPGRRDAKICGNPETL